MAHPDRPLDDLAAEPTAGPPEDASRMPHSPVLIAGFVALLAGATFLPSLSGGWILDDHLLLKDNPYIHSFSWWLRWFTTDFWDVGGEMLDLAGRIVYWRPLVSMTYAADWNLGGGSPVIFHVTNLLAHAAVSAMAFFVLRRWTGGALWPALFAALLFALHPTKAESVAWISGRTDVLCMLAILIATTGAARRMARRRGGLPLELIGTILAYFSKEQAIVLPMFIGVEAWVAAGRPAVDFSLIRRVVRSALPQIAVAIAYLLARALWLPLNSGTGLPVTSTDRVQAVLDTMGRFFELTFVPRDLSIQQGVLQVVDGRLLHSTGHVVLGVVGLLVLVGAAIAARRRYPHVTVGVTFYLLALAPTSNLMFTGIETLISERFLYLPILGLALPIGVFLAGMAAPRRRLAFTVAGAGIVIFGVLSALRAHDFSDERRFWERELALHPESTEAHMFKVGDAMTERRYLRALEALQTFREAMGRRAFDIFRFGHQLAEVTARLTPDRDTAGLRAIDAFCGELLDPGSEVAALRTRFFALELRKGNFSRARLSRQFAYVQTVKAGLALRLGQPEQAFLHLRAASADCPDCPTVAIAEAVALAAEDRFEDGLRLLNRLPTSDPRVRAAREALEKARGHHLRATASHGPASLLERAGMFSALELWGRAYEVLEPHREGIAQEPEVALGFAELAFRAGEFETARDVLSRHVEPAGIEALMQRWADTMGWRR